MSLKKYPGIFMLVLGAYCAHAQEKSSRADTSLYSKTQLLAIAKTTKTSLDTGFSIWFRYRKAVDKVMGSGYAERHVMNIMMQEDSNVTEANKKAAEGLKVIGRAGDQVYYAKKDKELIDPVPPDWDELHDGIKRKFGSYYANRMTKFTCMNYFKTRQLWPEYAHRLVIYYKAYPEDLSPSKQNEYAWNIFQYSRDKRALKLALKWSKTAVDANQQPVWAAVDTYANLLYKLNDTKQAVEEETSALMVAPDNQKQNVTETLHKMKTGKPTWPVISE